MKHLEYGLGVKITDGFGKPLEAGGRGSLAVFQYRMKIRDDKARKRADYLAWWTLSGSHTYYYLAPK